MTLQLVRGDSDAPKGRQEEALPVLEARGLSLRYGGRQAFRDVSFAVRPGRVIALIGPSGCGKTSLLSCVNRLTDLLPACQVSGDLLLHGADLLDDTLDVVALRRRVGMIFQKPNPFPMSITRNVELALREHGMGDKERIRERVEKSLRDVGLWGEVKDRLHEAARSLSGGQQQRLCIARALALQPDLLLFDEPCSALDPLSSDVVEDLILSLRGRLTQIVVTHNLGQARRIADDVGVFWVRDGVGGLIEFGEAQQVFESPRDPLTAAYVSGRRG